MTLSPSKIGAMDGVCFLLLIEQPPLKGELTLTLLCMNGRSRLGASHKYELLGGGLRPPRALFLVFHAFAPLSSFMYRKLAKGYIVCSVN